MKNVYIIDAVRSAVGSYLGGIKHLPAHQISSILINELAKKHDLSDLSEVILGEVLCGGHGQNTARQASVNAGISVNIPAMTINQVCGSGLRSVDIAAQFIKNGSHRLVIAGGQESMSQSRHASYLRQVKMGNQPMVDMMINDGLTDAFHQYHMGITAENLAKKYAITRAEQDEFAYNSHKKAIQAQKNKSFNDEIIPINIQTKTGNMIFAEDECVRKDINLDKLAKLSPVFDKQGTVTAGNSSSLNDGAALLLLADEDYIKKYKIKPLARIVPHAVSGVDPAIMGIGPVKAITRALDLAEWSISDLDIIEANEAFAVQAIAVSREIGWDLKKVNPNGGAVALGHPIGASGARIMVTLLHQLKHKKGQKGLASLCIGGGMGIAMCVESL